MIQHVREKFSCRDCESIRQALAPFHVVPRGWAGPSLLAMILFEKYGQHQPLNRQSERYTREGVNLGLSTLADQVGEHVPGNCGSYVRQVLQNGHGGGFGWACGQRGALSIRPLIKPRCEAPPF